MKRVLMSYLLLSLAFAPCGAEAGDRAGKVARRWVNDRVRPLSEQLAKETILRTLHELDLHAFNTLQRVYKRSLELYPDIEKNWFFLRLIDFKSDELTYVHEMTKKVLWTANEVETLVAQLAVGTEEVDRLEAEQARLISGETPEEFFVNPGLFPTVFLGEISLWDGLSFGMTFDEEGNTNPLTLIFDTIQNLIKLYNNNKNIKDLKRAQDEFYNRKINDQDYLQLANTLVIEKGPGSLELTRKIQTKLTTTYHDAQRLSGALNETLGYLVQRRDKLIDLYIEQKIQREKEQFDERYYYPHLQGVDLTFLQEERGLKAEIETLRMEPGASDYIERAEALMLRKEALVRLRVRWHSFRNGERI